MRSSISGWHTHGRRTSRLVLPVLTALATAGLAPAALAGTGGPDAAGYRYIDSNESGGPTYNFEDISGTGTHVGGLSDDNMVGPFALGFTFEYYGTDYTQIYMSSNCFLTVLSGQDDGCCNSETIPSATDPNGIIAGWYEDVDPRVGDVYYQTLGSSPDRRFIVQWQAVKLYGASDTITVEFKLFERDDSIEVHYQQAVTDGGAFAAGIENQGGTVGLQYYRSSTDLTTPVAVKYFLNPIALSIARADSSPTNASSVDYTVTFSEGVSGVDTTDFVLTTSGVSGTSVTSVTPVSTSVYTVTVNAGTGDGTIRLDLDDDDTIASTATSDKLGGTGNDNGDFSGESYTIDRTGPEADSSERRDSDPTTDAQVGYIFKFDEAVDGVGTADFSITTTGSLSGSSVASVSPAFGNALDMSNNPEVGGKRLLLGSDSSLQVSAITLEAWVNFQKDGAETIISKGDGGGGTTDYIFQINKDGASKLNFWAGGGWDNSSSAVSPNTWTHVAVTYNGSNKKFYINGSLDRTVARVSTIAQSGLNAYIGRQGQNSDTGYFDGKLDEVRVWSAVHDVSTIQSTMNSTLLGSETGLVGYWRFEQFQNLGADAAGVNDIEDCSANSNHGDAVNSPTLTTSHFSGLAPEYVVLVNSGDGVGTIKLVLEDDDSIMDEANNVFGGAGTQDYTGGQTYTVNRPAPPTVTTTSASSVTGTTADSGGNVTADGGASVTARGACWNTSGTPTTADDKTSDGTGTGAFTSNITGLALGTTYYVRAYATNSAGTAYGSQKSFTTLSKPTVTTAATTAVTPMSADTGGNVTADGGASVTARGVCFNTTGTPTIADNKTSDGTGTGAYASCLSDLTANTIYYVRAYATSSVGTGYGSEVIFTTAPAGGAPDDCPDDPKKFMPGNCGCGVPDTDTDRDGTSDCNDECPDDASKTEPGTCGCGVSDVDSDGDGALDCVDGCPDDPELSEPNPCGCGVEQTDADADGTPDCIDDCPDDIDKTDPGACGCGAPDTDTDADGTPDCVDQCPDNPDKTEPNEYGCHGDTTTDQNQAAEVYNDDIQATVEGLEDDAYVAVSTDETGTTTLITNDANGEVMLTVIADDLGDGGRIDVSIDEVGNPTVTLVNDAGVSLTINTIDYPPGIVIEAVRDDQGLITVAVTDHSGTARTVVLEAVGFDRDIVVNVIYNDSGQQSAQAVPGVDATVVAGGDEWANADSVTLEAVGLLESAVLLIAIEYREADYAEGDESELRLYRLDEQTGQYAPAGTNDVGVASPTQTLGDYGVDTTAKTVWALVDQLGTFSIPPATGQRDTSGLTPIAEDEYHTILRRTPVCGLFGGVPLTGLLLCVGGWRLSRRGSSRPRAASSTRR